MSKTPFEVRLDVVKMAKEMLETEFAAKERKHREMSEILMVNNIGSLEKHNSSYPEPYTEDDVLTKSNSIYSFVTDKYNK